MSPKSFIRWVAKDLCVAAVLASACVAIYYSVYWIRFEGVLREPQTTLFWGLLPFVIAAKLAVFYGFRLHKAWSRYVTFNDVLRLVEAASLSSLLIVLADYFLLPLLQTPRSVVLMDWAATVGLAAGVRGLSRSVRERYLPLFKEVGERVLIVGANDGGESLLRALKLNRSVRYKVVGFLDDSPTRNGLSIAGVPVLGPISNACEIARRHDVKEVMMITGANSGVSARKLVDECRKHDIRVRMLPSYDQLLNGNVAVQIRDVSIEDLLRRDPVQLETDNINHWLQGRVLLVTGGAGSIGSEICRQLLVFGPSKLILVDRSENGLFQIERELRALAPHAELQFCIADINDQRRMRQVMEQCKPDVMFHTAAFKHVPLMEAHPGEAVKNNVLATRQLANLADEYGLEAFVMVSTDKAVNPTSVMGTCKRVAELYVQSMAEQSDCRFVIVRFGNVLDSAGSVIPIFRDQIKRGGPVTVTDTRMERFFMTIPEAAQLVIQAGCMGQGGEIYVLDMGEPVRIVDLAHDMIRLSGLTVGRDIEIEVVGLRPGEKLFEELHVDGETHLPTQHPKIVVAKSNTEDEMDINLAINHLQTLTEQPSEEILNALKSIVPQYKHDVTPTIPFPQTPVQPERKSA